MATLKELCDQERLHRLKPDLDADQMQRRAVVIFDHVRSQIAALCGVASPTGNEFDLDEQFDALIYSFCIGEQFQLPGDFHEMDHRDPGVWELKTADLRLFGWFYRRDVFIVTDVKDATFVKKGPENVTVTVSLYHGFCTSAVHWRDQLDLDPPKFVDGKHPENVLSNYVVR